MNGWRDGSHCIGGAWNIAQHGFEGWSWDDASYVRLAELIVAQHPEWARVYTCADDAIFLIASWNNDEHTTEADVRAILEKLAAG